ncbi:ACP S-malonyltransferase [Hydrogenophaga sp. BPS33]|uniref:ACP S-malonyltransferase n=1 Tax=Hydrogenophaga sp. BPS33 TaxID=2651974 RepID=UPI00131F904B|nr:ACP S-malonyltransferase [Hydrogenophaga sp. BPS33]QHE85103.1 ACP S-malonyltransferase [Hydrogenophaga sp. BPS33]
MKNFAFVFPGQGSQSVGMLDAWADHPAVVETLKESSDAMGEDIGMLIREGPADVLAMTINTQPVMLVAGIAAWRVWRAEGGALPAAVAGHSLGEYSALVAAGVLSLAQAVPLVRFRAQAMQDAVPAGTGAMAAVLGLGADAVAAGCREAQATFARDSAEVVEAVNFNDPVQTVIAGSKAAVDKACEMLRAMGAKRTLPLPVSAPFHSSLMKPAAEKLKERLAVTTFLAPQIPMINNIDVLVESDPDRIRDALYRQAFGPVRWVECVRAIKARGIDTVVECGPRKALTAMVKRVDPSLTGAALFDPATLAEVQALLA